jgi:hypothetical protein
MHFAEYLQRELANKITRALKERVCLGLRDTIILEQLRHLVPACLEDTTQLYLHTPRETMPSSPRCRSTLDLAELYSPISYVECSPAATTDAPLENCDSGYTSIANDDWTPVCFQYETFYEDCELSLEQSVPESLIPAKYVGFNSTLDSRH